MNSTWLRWFLWPLAKQRPPQEVAGEITCKRKGIGVEGSETFARICERGKTQTLALQEFRVQNQLFRLICKSAVFHQPFISNLSCFGQGTKRVLLGCCSNGATTLLGLCPLPRVSQGQNQLSVGFYVRLFRGQLGFWVLGRRNFVDDYGWILLRHC